MSFLVLDPGIESRIVDLGRPRTRSLGVPVGGAADRTALTLGNALVGNPPDAAALEIALKGPRLRAQADIGCVLFGAPFDVFHEGVRRENARTFTVRAGDELRIDSTKPGVRAYLCVCGGFQTKVILGSKSAFEPVRKGDALPCVSSAIRARFSPELAREFPSYSFPPPVWFDFAPDPWSIRVLPGAQADWFHEPEFFDQQFVATPSSNRMGVRLRSNPLTMPNREMISEPVCPGTVQVTRDGQCIVLGVDGQTIGGYPKIAQVIQRDLDMLGQLHPGQPICFRKVSSENALAWDREARQTVEHWATRLRLSLDAFPAERTL